MEVSFGELTRDGHKVFTGFIRDISARKNAEEKLRASERSLRELTETIPQMLWSAEPDGAVDYCNQRALDYTGLSAEQVRGAGWMKTVHRDDIESMSRAWTTAVSSGEPFQQEFRCLRAADQTYRWCISRALPLRDPSGRILKWFGTVVDLHDWKQAQQALQMTQAELARVSRLTTMGELAASIAHEVNQPLTAVTNNGSACLRLLANRSLEPEVLRRALEEIVADGTRASAVIARIRGFIKKAPVEKTELDLNEVIQEVLALAGHELHKNQVLVECQLSDTLPLVRTDRVQVQQVLLNLIMNSIEAMTGAIINLEYSLWNPGSMNPATCWLRSATRARASVQKQIVYSLHSSRQRQMAWAWGCLLAAHSSKVTADDSGPHPTRLTVLCFHLRCQQSVKVIHEASIPKGGDGRQGEGETSLNPHHLRSTPPSR